MYLLCNQQEKVHFLPSLLHHNFPTEGKRKKGERNQKEKISTTSQIQLLFYPSNYHFFSFQLFPLFKENNYVFH